ncbi:MAG: hypothetical protein B193_1980 [Solidesulfovibrio magneticus str. Maddingley MBC34]|uniref:Uncharacterized protein n=1 Tax=Solidesulfovibrio magneticus str. Maddingley MBC34 TaxID=1206767 RepID=K6H9Y1_9BACT|nr:MAG: hypothetical protein B193_1980 [Solidesulfovibrio magneticus str. Maddingley MBC34]
MRRVPSGPAKPADDVEVVRISLDGAVAVERLSGRALRGRRFRLSFFGLLAVLAGYFLLLAGGVVVVADCYALPLPALDPELYDLVQKYLRSPAIIWLGYCVSPAAILVCLLLSRVDARRSTQGFWIFFSIMLLSIIVASWKAILPKHWLGFPVFSICLWVVVYAESLAFAARLRRRHLRRRR